MSVPLEKASGGRRYAAREDLCCLRGPARGGSMPSDERFPARLPILPGTGGSAMTAKGRWVLLVGLGLALLPGRSVLGASKLRCRAWCGRALRDCPTYVGNSKRWCAKYVGKKCRREPDGPLFCQVHDLRIDWDLALGDELLRVSFQSYPQRGVGGELLSGAAEGWGLEGTADSLTPGEHQRWRVRAFTGGEAQAGDAVLAWALTFQNAERCLAAFVTQSGFDGATLTGLAYTTAHPDCMGRLDLVGEVRGQRVGSRIRVF